MPELTACKVFVKILEARSLEGINSDNMSDPYVTVSIQPTANLSRTTQTKISTINQYWNESFSFNDVMLTESDFTREKIGLSVYNRNFFSANSLLGTVEFSLPNIYRQPNHEYYRKWVPIVEPEQPDRSKGWLLVHLFVLKPGDRAPWHDMDKAFMNAEAVRDPTKDAPKACTNFLRVLVYRGENIRGEYASVNPFVSVRFNGNSVQTKRIQSKNPVFNQRIEIPFQKPITSETVEIQLWDSKFGRPDKLLGHFTLSYHDESLDFSPWGPRWVPFYAYRKANTTMVGKMIEGFEKKRDNSKVYVGKLLLRVSVKMTFDPLANQRVAVTVCRPSGERKRIRYVARLGLRKASELAVKGGKVFVELAFGSGKVESKPRLGMNGSYCWSGSKMLTAFAYGPEDVSQLPDVLITVYNKVGVVKRKIGTERVSASQWLSNLRTPYAINGICSDNAESRHWVPQWRKLTSPDSTAKSGGYLLGLLEIGKESDTPDRRKRPAQKEYRRMHYNLRAIIYRAQLFLNDWNGALNPAVTVSLADEDLAFTPKYNTRFPQWEELKESKNEIIVVPQYQESMYITLYHQGLTGKTLLGRSRVLIRDILEYAQEISSFTPIQRYYFQMEHEGKSKGKYGDLTKSYVLAQFSLYVKEDAKCELPLPLEWKNLRYEVEKKAFTVTIQLFSYISLLKLWEPQFKDPILCITFPGCKSDPNPLKVPLKVSSVGSAKIGQQFQINVKANPYEIYNQIMKFELKDGRSVVAISYLRFNQFADGFLEPPEYEPKYDDTLHDRVVREKQQYDNAITAAQRALAVKQSMEREIEKKKQENEEFKAKNINELKTNSLDDSTGSRSQNDSEQNDGNENGEEKKDFDEKIIEQDDTVDQYEEKSIINQHLLAEDNAKGNNGNAFLVLDIKNANSTFIPEGSAVIRAPQAKDSLEATHHDAKEQIIHHDAQETHQMEAELLEEKVRKNSDFLYSVRLHKINCEGSVAMDSTGSLLPSEVARNQSIVGLVRAMISIRPEKITNENEKKVLSVSQMETSVLTNITRELFGSRYTFRLYIHRAGFIAQEYSREEESVYIVVQNGKGDENYLSKERSAVEAFNPAFYEVIELTGSFPFNSILQVSLWCKGTVSDRLIGSTILDTEWRLLQGVTQGAEEQRMLHHPDHETPQGNLVMSLDIVKESVAARIKPRPLIPPLSKMYQVRLVIYTTDGVRHPQRELRNKDVHQRIRVTANFDGKASGEVVKKTDIAWSTPAGSAAEWNYRMIFNVRLPCRNPRLKIAVWAANTFQVDTAACAEVNYNLHSKFLQILRENESSKVYKEHAVELEHSNFPGEAFGVMFMEVRIMTENQARANPVGEAQNEPNKDPFLPKPVRNAEPWHPVSNLLDRLSMMRLKCIIITIFVFAVIALILVLIVPILVTSAQSF